MNVLRAIVAMVVCVSLPIAGVAAPHAIAQLGSAPLIGQITSTPQLQTNVSVNDRIFASAASKIGLTPREYAMFATRVQSRQLAYVTIPRHLDAMAWSSGGRVYAVHDVVIPAGTHGWEVDLVERHSLVAVFVPQRCGNLSVVRRPLPALARAGTAPAHATAPAHVTAPAVRVAAEQTGPPAPTTITAPAKPAPAGAPGAAAATASPGPAISMPQPAATAPPFQGVAASTGPPSHRSRWWPLLLVPVVAFFGSHGGGHSSIPQLPFVAPPTIGSNAGPPGGGGGSLAVPPLPPGCPGPTATPH